MNIIKELELQKEQEKTEEFRRDYYFNTINKDGTEEDWELWRHGMIALYDSLKDDEEKA